MFADFFFELRAARVPVSLREYLTLIEAMDRDIALHSVEDFYYLARAALVKDERNIDKFDRVFGRVFKGLGGEPGPGVDGLSADIPEEWLRRIAERVLTDEEKALIKSLGGFDKLMETLKKRLAEQKSRHQGGNKWIGTAGISPFGAYGYHPEGVRIGQDGNRNYRAVKVWDRREFKNLDDHVEIGVRNIKIALRRLRRFAREGAADVLDLSDTIQSTARRGWLDVRMVPERHNAVKVLLFLDIGGSMDMHVRLMAELFSAARSEFKHLEYFYFHNFLYERVWKDNARRHAETIPTPEVLRTYPSDYRVLIVGDASMSPYEITHPGGSVEHWNQEPGAVWMQRLLDVYPRVAWLNPVPPEWWGATASIGMVRRIMGGRMHPTTLDGLEAATRELAR